MATIPSSVAHDGSEHPATGYRALDEAEKKSIRILVVDDEATLRETCGSVLRMQGFDVTVVGRGQEALDLVKRKQFQIVLCDLFMTQVSGMVLLQTIMETHPDTIVVMMTGKPSVASNISALEEGAWDYLPKPFSATHLEILIGRAAHAVQQAREARARRERDEAGPGGDGKVSVLGQSQALNKAIQLAKKVARSNASVFISGESGTGKELIAQYIHHHSRRAAKAIMAVNCAALPEPLLESEMFGHVKGAFTGAVSDKVGLFEAAHMGTLFLDEVTEMPQPIQAKLLRVIQDGAVRRVGSNETNAVVDVRFLAATNRDPAAAVREGSLRSDLYYRLRVVPIHMPPLRQRLEDIPVLANHFLVHYWQRDHDGEAPPTLSQDALRALRSYSWPGNIRELQNVIEHTAVLTPPGSEISGADIPFPDDQIGEEVTPLGSDPSLFQEEYHVARDRLLDEFEKRYVTSLVSRADGNMSKAARLAGVDRTTLYRLIDKHGLEREAILRDS